MITFDDLRFVETLSRLGTLSAAARSLNVSAPALSTRLKRLEQKLGISIAIRNSRTVRFTPAGEQLVAEARNLLAQADALPDLLTRETRGLRGAINVMAPFGFGRHYVAPLGAEFAEQHPDVRLTLDLSERPWADGGRADVIIHIGNVRDSSWISHLLARNERWLCASPAYLKAAGVPQHPRDLLKHSCLCLRENDEDVTLWHYRDANGKKGSVRVAPRYTSNDGEVVRDWAIGGLGIVMRSQWDAARFVKRGALRRILPDTAFGQADVVALVSARRGLSLRVSRFIDFLKHRLRKRNVWD